LEVLLDEAVGGSEGVIMIGRRNWKPQALTCSPWAYRDATTCRVCSRSIAQGDQCWSWRWDNATHGCASCGWYRLDDFNAAELRALADVATSCRDRHTVAREAIVLLVERRILVIDEATKRFKFTEVGRPLRDLMLRRAA
jgi:predicted transcriptional regulator